MYDPRSEGHISKKQKECWALCNTAAVMAIKGTLPNVIGDSNMLAN
jgi:NADH:ubiquinone oxidoreductase subunit E